MCWLSGELPVGTDARCAAQGQDGEHQTGAKPWLGETVPSILAHPGGDAHGRVWCGRHFSSKAILCTKVTCLETSLPLGLRCKLAASLNIFFLIF